MRRLKFAASWDAPSSSVAKVLHDPDFLRFPKQAPVDPTRITPSRRREVISTRALSFEEFAKALDPDGQTDLHPRAWKKVIDHENQSALFYQLDLSGEEPKLSKCLRIKKEEFRIGNRKEPRLVPTVFLDEALLIAKGDQRLLVSSALDTVQDVNRMLQYVDLYPDLPDVPEEIRGGDVAAPVIEGSFPQRPIAGSDGDSGSESEGDEAVASVIRYHPDPVVASRLQPPASPAKNPGSLGLTQPRNPESPSKQPDTSLVPDDCDPLTGLKPEQTLLLARVKQHLSIPDPDKEELYPGADVYFDADFLKSFRQDLQQPKYEPKRDAGDLAVILIDSMGAVFEHIRPSQHAVRSAFGVDLLNIILNFIDKSHGMIASKQRPELTEGALVRALWTKLIHLKKKAQDPEYTVRMRHQYRKETREKKKGIDPDEGSEESLVPFNPQVPWNPALPYNDPAFVPSYLIARPGYESIIPLTSTALISHALRDFFPKLHMKAEFLSYYKSQKSHDEFPDSTKWIRDFLYKLLDESALLHMAFLYEKELAAGRKFVRFRRCVSQGFVEILDAFLRSEGKLNYDVGFLLCLLNRWRRNMLRPCRKRVQGQDAAKLGKWRKVQSVFTTDSDEEESPKRKRHS